MKFEVTGDRYLSLGCTNANRNVYSAGRVEMAKWTNESGSLSVILLKGVTIERNALELEDIRDADVVIAAKIRETSNLNTPRVIGLSPMFIMQKRELAAYVLKLVLDLMETYSSNEDTKSIEDGLKSLGIELGGYMDPWATIMGARITEPRHSVVVDINKLTKRVIKMGKDTDE